MVDDVTLSDAQIRAAARWWSDCLRRKVEVSGLSDDERKDPRNRDYELAERLVSAERPTYTVEQADAFERELVVELTTRGWQLRSLSVDYAPDVYLVRAMERAGLEGLALDFALPWKTMMTFHDGGVQVSEGYGAPWVEVET